MARIILAIIAGFIVWSVLWVGSHVLLTVLSPGWYGKVDADFQDAMQKGLPFTVDSAVLLLSLGRSVIISLVSGFVTASVARENVLSVWILAILLLLVGLATQIAYWIYMPLWYHLPFLILLIPMTILGGKLRKL